MQKLPTGSYINDWDPTNQRVYSASQWYKSETLKDVPEASVGWLVAQGWAITDTDKDAQTCSMSRRSIDPEQVLNAMVADYISAYNEGRQVNDQRYDDIVAIYLAMQGQLEDEYLNQAINDTSYYDLVSTIISGISTDQASYEDDATGQLDGYGDSIREQVNARFDAKLEMSRQELVTRGMYNSTVWDSVSAGVERERSLALSDIEDKITQQQLALTHTIHADKTTVTAQILAAHERLKSQMHAAADRFQASRNAIVTALVNFMERRTDGYPDLNAIGRLAADLGAGNPAGFQP